MVGDAKKVQIVEKSEQDYYDTVTSLFCFGCNADLAKSEKVSF
jgi:hypothetical protein